MIQYFEKHYANTGAISTGDYWVVPVSETDVANYAPFEHFQLFNDSGAGIDIEPNFNQNKKITLGAKLSFSQNQRFGMIRIKNNSSQDIAIGDLRIKIKNRQEVI